MKKYSKMELIIRQFVRDNFGESEVVNPSWDIGELAGYIERELGIKSEKDTKLNYAVIGTFVDSDNDVVLDYFETEEEAEKFADKVNCDDELYCDLEFVNVYKIEKR